MAPRRKLTDDEKDAIAQTFNEDDFRRHWVAGDPDSTSFVTRNTCDGVLFNHYDTGFQHLNLPAAKPHDFKDIPAPPPAFQTFTAEQNAAYLHAVHAKLSLANSYISKEKELGLDPDRPGMHKELTSTLLGQGTIRIDMNAQQYIRLLIDSGDELQRLGENMSEEHRKEAEKMMAGQMGDYWQLYLSLLASLEWQMLGKNEGEKRMRADAIVEGVLGKLVEA
jgi:hypothetical protein